MPYVCIAFKLLNLHIDANYLEVRTGEDTVQLGVSARVGVFSCFSCTLTYCFDRNPYAIVKIIAWTNLFFVIHSFVSFSNWSNPIKIEFKAEKKLGERHTNKNKIARNSYCMLDNGFLFNTHKNPVNWKFSLVFFFSLAQ